MQLQVNGETVTAPDGIHLPALLTQMDVASDHVAILLNDEAVPRAQYADVALHTGDRLELLTFAGGG